MSQVHDFFALSNNGQRKILVQLQESLATLIKHDYVLEKTSVSTLMSDLITTGNAIRSIDADEKYQRELNASIAAALNAVRGVEVAVDAVIGAFKKAHDDDCVDAGVESWKRSIAQPQSGLQNSHLDQENGKREDSYSLQGKPATSAKVSIDYSALQAYLRSHGIDFSRVNFSKWYAGSSRVQRITKELSNGQALKTADQEFIVKTPH